MFAIPPCDVYCLVICADVYGTSFGRPKTTDDTIIPDLPAHVSRDATQGGVPHQVPAQCPITEQQLGGAVQTPPQPRPKPGDCWYLLHNVVKHHQRAQKTSEGIEIADPEESTAAEKSISPYASPEVQEFIRGQSLLGPLAELGSGNTSRSPPSPSTLPPVSTWLKTCRQEQD
ncbi:hypothetical protein O3P69_017806 [Scylla paramamosain]|uniref:Uncharacterized protein n=1 Tax=Scylla paramamosain TaxID=85552 RepID=A0AAW0SJ54_SCYPA